MYMPCWGVRCSCVTQGWGTHVLLWLEGDWGSCFTACQCWPLFLPLSHMVGPCSHPGEYEHDREICLHHPLSSLSQWPLSWLLWIQGCSIHLNSRTKLILCRTFSQLTMDRGKQMLVVKCWVGQNTMYSKWCIWLLGFEFNSQQCRCSNLNKLSPFGPRRNHTILKELTFFFLKLYTTNN